MSVLRRRPAVGLSIERLETRATPAAITLSAGNLFISNNKGAILLDQQASGAFQVKDAGVNFGTYLVGNNITINTGNFNDSVIVNLFAGKLVGGNLNINTSNGNDTVHVLSASGFGVGRIGGSLIINAGFGNDTINLAVDGDNVLRVNGATSISASAGIDKTSIGFVALNGGLTATQSNSFIMGAVKVSSVDGNVTIDNSADGAAPNFINIKSTAQIGGSFKYVGGPGADEIEIAGNLHFTAGASSTVNAGEGKNTLLLSGFIGVGTADSNFTFTGANNIPSSFDTVAITDTAVVSGNLKLTMNNGANFYDLADNFFVGGDFTLAAGSDNDAVGDINAQVNGNASVSLGGGDDEITFGTMGLGVGSIGGNLTVDALAGDDTIQVNINVGGGGPGTGDVIINLGSGADVFMACDAVFSSWGSATIDLGVGDTDGDFSETLFTLVVSYNPASIGGNDTITTC